MPSSMPSIKSPRMLSVRGNAPPLRWTRRSALPSTVPWIGPSSAAPAPASVPVTFVPDCCSCILTSLVPVALPPIQVPLKSAGPGLALGLEAAAQPESAVMSDPRTSSVNVFTMCVPPPVRLPPWRTPSRRHRAGCGFLRPVRPLPRWRSWGEVRSRDAVHERLGAQECRAAFERLAEALGYADRRRVPGPDQADHAGPVELGECVLDRAPRAFGRIALAPRAARERPDALEARPAVGIEESDAADERAGRALLHRPHPVSA